MHRRVARTLVLAGLMVMPGCTRNKLPMDALAEPKAGEGDEPAAPIRQAPEPVAVAQSVLEMLPASTLAVGWAPDPAALVDALGRKEVLAKFPDETAQIRQQSEAFLGVDLLDPENFRDLGIDPHGAAGFAALDVRSQAACGFVTVADETKLLEVLRKVGGEDLRVRTVDRASLISVGREATLVLRDGFAILVFVDDLDAAREDYPMVVAAADPKQSLAISRRFQDADRSIAQGGLLRGYLDVEGTVDAALRAEAAEDETPQWLVRELEEARRTGAPADEIRRLERDIEMHREEAARWRNRRQAEYDLIRALFLPIKSLSGRMAVEKGAVVGEAHLMTESGLLRDLVRPTGEASQALRAASGEPLLLLEGAADPDAVKKLAALAARADGMTLEEASAEMRRETGVDLLTEVFPVFDGLAGMVVTVPKPVTPKDVARFRGDVDFGVYARLKDPAAAKQVLERLMKSPEVAKDVKRDGKSGGWTFEEDDQRWYLVIEGDDLVATTDRKFLSRIANGTDGGAAGRIGRAATELEAADIAGRLFASATLPVLVSTYVPDVMTAENIDQSLRFSGEWTPQEYDKIPKSREYKRAVKRAEKRWKAIHAAEMAEAEREAKAALRITEALGAFVVRGQEVPSGIHFNGGLFLGVDDLPAVVLTAIDEIRAEMDAPPLPNADPSGEKWQLNDDLRRMRQQEARDHLQKKKK